MAHQFVQTPTALNSITHLNLNAQHIRKRNFSRLRAHKKPLSLGSFVSDVYVERWNDKQNTLPSIHDLHAIIIIIILMRQHERVQTPRNI